MNTNDNYTPLTRMTNDDFLDYLTQVVMDLSFEDSKSAKKYVARATKIYKDDVEHLAALCLAMNSVAWTKYRLDKSDTLASVLFCESRNLDLTVYDKMPEDDAVQYYNIKDYNWFN